MTDLDARLHKWIVLHRTPAYTKPMLVVTRLGSSPAVCVAMATLPPALTLVLTGSSRLAREEGKTALQVLVTGLTLRRVLMWTWRRPRPPHSHWQQDASGFAFPSGHSTNAAMAATLLIGTVQARRGSPVVTAACATYAAAVGASRMYLGVHWPSDVLAGWLLGATWSVLGRRLLTK
jgi:membrane-associated phospholipid phosphatase